jgi:hypothetical protein
MSASLVKVLGLGPKEKDALAGTVHKIKSVSEFLAEALPKAGKLGFVGAIAEAAPWFGAVMGAAEEAFPAVKFVVSLFSKLTEERDPAQLAFLACTLAYERSIEQAVKALDLATVPHSLDDRELATKLEAAERERTAAVRGAPAEEGKTPFDLERFSFGGALLHPFVVESDKVLNTYAEAAGYSEQQRRALQNEVHQRFVTNLKTLISHGATKEKFAPLQTRMSLGTGDALLGEALTDHAEYQRWLFEEQRVFGTEPFTLSQVYVETDCGVLTWGRIIRDGIDPFSERHGGREALGEEVLKLMGDPGFKDAIVIQGAAGAGKSTFTLYAKACARSVSG